jgi:hypothetical protein
MSTLRQRHNNNLVWNDDATTAFEHNDVINDAPRKRPHNYLLYHFYIQIHATGVLV